MCGERVRFNPQINNHNEFFRIVLKNINERRFSLILFFMNKYSYKTEFFNPKVCLNNNKTTALVYYTRY